MPHFAEAQGAAEFSLVCLRKLDEEIPFGEGRIQAVSLSHDRRLLCLRDRRGRCLCYSCDSARPAFLLRQPVADGVEQNVWMHMPTEKTVLLRQNALSEYPGLPCLVALHPETDALSICLFFRIESRDVAIVDSRVRLASGPAELETTKLLGTWEGEIHPEDLPSNTVWRYSVPLADIVRLLPNIHPLLTFRSGHRASCDQAATPTERPVPAQSSVLARTCRTRLCAAKPSTLALVFDDVAVVLLDFSRRGLGISGGFFMQRPTAGPQVASGACAVGSPPVRPSSSAPDEATAEGAAAPAAPPAPVHAVGPGVSSTQRFCDVVACQDWIFAITQPPRPLLLIWSLSGIAFHTIPLGDYIKDGTSFTSIVVALDLLAAALCDNNHDVWILSLSDYFEVTPEGLDWDFLKERQRCAEGVGLLGRMEPDYLEVSCFPEASGLPSDLRERVAGRGLLRRSTQSTVMDCLVEGVPTYGIPIAGGAFGVGDRLFRDCQHPSDALATETRSTGADGAGSGPSLMRSPLAWYERISYTHEWREVDRRWWVARAERLKSRGAIASSLIGGGVSGAGEHEQNGVSNVLVNSMANPTSMLNGFSVPPQHRLGDDDLLYSLHAAVRKHAQRQFESCLPPWLTRIKLPLKAQSIDPPTFGGLGAQRDDGRLGSDSSEEEEEDEDAQHATPTSDAVGESELATGSINCGRDGEGVPIAELRKWLTETMGQGGQGGPAASAPEFVAESGRCRSQVAHVKVSIAASDVFCEIWKYRRRRRKRPIAGHEGDRDGDGDDEALDICPWAVCVIPRMGTSELQTGAEAQTDHLTGGLLPNLLHGQGESKDRKIVTLRSGRRLMPLLTQNHVWYMLGRDGRLFALLLQQSPLRVISNLLVFEERAKASRLCALNGWSATQLPVLTLFLGLRFRELNQISLSLTLLRPHQEMEACRMIVDFINAGYTCASMKLPFSPGPQPSPDSSAASYTRTINGLDERAPSAPGGQLAGVQPAAVKDRLMPPMASHTQHSTTVVYAEGKAGQAPPSLTPPSVEPVSGTLASQLPADRSFVSRLLEIAMQFATKLIQTRVRRIQDSAGACRALTYLQPTHAASEPAEYAAMVHELTQLTVHMQALRCVQQQLIRSFGDDKAYDSVVVIQCPAQEASADNARFVVTKGVVGSSAAKGQQGETGKDKDQLGMVRTAEGAEAIVRGALISGRVSSALIWFHELAQDEGRDGDVFQDFRVTAGRLAYQLVCNQQVDFLFVAMHMLRNVGESINRFFKGVAFHTSKRLVRRRLLKHLKHIRRLTDEDRALISLVNMMERLYTNPCYTTEFNRMTTSLTTGRYPLRAHQKSFPPFCTWPAGGPRMLSVGLSCDGAIGGNVNTHASVGDGSGSHAYEQHTSLRELPMSQRMPLELHDMWAGYQTPVMAAMLEVPSDARRAWSRLPCGDVDDLDAQPVLGLANFHKASNLEGEPERAIETSDDVRDQDGGEGDCDAVVVARTTNVGGQTTCRMCQKEGALDDIDADHPSTKSASAIVPDGENFCEALGIGRGCPDHQVMGYLHVTLSWVRRWSWATRARVLMEKTHFRPRLLQTLPWLQPPADEGKPEHAWRRCWLDFLVAHQDWRGLASWVRCMPLEAEDCVDSQGTSRFDLSHLEGRGLPFCTPHTREILLQELGRRGIFCRADTQSFSALLRRLAQCGRLFGGGGGGPSSSSKEAGEAPPICGDEADHSPNAVATLALDRLLPSRDVCAFHRFFIHLCIDRDLPSVMLLYLQNYKLATTMADLKALQLRHAAKPWASLLLVGRLGNAHLFAASLQHAAIVFGGSHHAGGGGLGARTSRDAEDVPFMPLIGLASCSPRAFLATLMFAPVPSAFAAAKAGLDSPWRVDLDLLWQVVCEYPTLCEALFPSGAPSAFANSAAESSIVGSQTDLDTSLVESVAVASHDRWARQQDNDRMDDEMRGSVVEACSAAATPGGVVEERRPRQTLDDMRTFKGDVSLLHLLSDVAAFDVRQALGPLPLFLENGGVDGGLAALVEPGERFCDELGEGYFLAQGRTMMAFHVLLTKCAHNAGPSRELRFPLVLPREDMRRLHKVAKSVALYNLLNEGVVSSAVCLLELCSLETEVLRVDVQAAKRIYEHNVRQAPGRASGEDWDRSRAAAASVIELFLSFPDTEDTPSRAAEAAINSGHLLTALRMLEESTWALDPHPSAPSVSSLQALAYDSPWHLVALFCRVHSLPRSLTLLHELARNNDWVMFLHESDLQQCPADTVLDILDGYFTDMSLQHHLEILARSIAVQEQEECALRLGEDPRMEAGAGRTPPGGAPPAGGLGVDVADAIGFLEGCRSGGLGFGTGYGLLRHALRNRAARLAVMASAFSDVTPLQCMAVWLTVNTERSQAQTGLAEGQHASAEAVVQSSPAEVAAQIAALCRKNHAFSLVLRALKIFDPSNPLVDFVKFHRAFVQCRFQSCGGHMDNFVRRRDSESRAPPQQRVESYCLELVPHVVSLSEEMVQYLLDGFPQARMMLLSVLHQANFSPDYSHLFRSFRLVQQAGLNVDFRVPSMELLQLLISRKMFIEAREWARSSGLVGDTIVFEEVTGMIVEFRQGAWWNVLDERLQLWHECYCAFIRQSYPPVGAAIFFLDITNKLESELFAREQLMLLCIAFELLRGPAEEEAGGGAARASPKEATDAFPANTPNALSKEQLSRIKLSMLLILTGTNKDLAVVIDFAPLDLSYGTLRTLARRIPEGVAALPLYSPNGGAFSAGISTAAIGSAGVGVPALALKQRDGPRRELIPYLETAVSSLINCDEIAWAKRLAQGFGFESVDLHLVEVLEKVACGNHKEALMELTLGRAVPELPSVEDCDAEPLLQSLCTQCSARVALFCRRCKVFYAVSRTISMDYRQVSQVDVRELLDRLLGTQPYMGDIALCRALLSCYPKPPNKATIAEVLAHCFLRSTLDLGIEWPEEKLDEFASLLGAQPELLGDAALRGIPHFRQGLAPEPEAAAELAAVLPSTKMDALPLECEVEVLVLAYRAYVQACHERSIVDFLRFLRGRVEVYVERGRFPLLVRLLVAIPEYHATEYMFGDLVRHHQLDLLLEKGSGGMASPALPVALVRYLHDHFPRNLELLVKVHRCFGLDSDLACLLEQRAKALAQGIGRKWERICSEEGEEKLLMCLSLFLQCSRFFLRAKRYQKHLVANEQAALVGLQLKSVQIHLAASLQEQQQQAAAAALRRAERAERCAERKALAQAQARRDEAELSELDSGLRRAAAPSPQFLAHPAPSEDVALLGETTPRFGGDRSANWAEVGGLLFGLPGAEAATITAAGVAALEPQEAVEAVVVREASNAVGAGGGGNACAAGATRAAEDSLGAGDDIVAAVGSAPTSPVTAFFLDPSKSDSDGGASAPRQEATALEAVPGPQLLSLPEAPVGSALERAEEEDELEAGGGGCIPAAPLGSMGDPFVVINLEAAEVRVFAEYHHDFIAAFQVVSAYSHAFGPSLAAVWPRALYRQVVLLGNRTYLQQFLLHSPLERETLEAAAALYLGESCPEQYPFRAQRMKQFLRDGVPNLETLYQLAKQLGTGFTDISIETASSIYMA